jgi:hypothetical protein
VKGSSLSPCFLFGSHAHACPRRGSDADTIEVHDPPATNRVPFGAQQRRFQLRIAPEAPDASARGDDAMVGQPGLCGFAHDVADGSRRSGAAGEPGDVAVCRDSPDRDASDDCEHTTHEDR